MEESFIIYEGVVVPESVVFRREGKDPYGGVTGLAWFTNPVIDQHIASLLGFELVRVDQI